MKDDNLKEQSQRDKKVKIIATLIFLVCITASLILITQYLQPKSSISISDIPLSKFSQGYDIVCNALDHRELCIYEKSIRTFEKTNQTMAFYDNSTGNSKIVSFFSINPVSKIYRIKEYHVEWGNQSTYFSPWTGFDKSRFTETINDTKDNLTSNFIVFENDSK